MAVQSDDVGGPFTGTLASVRRAAMTVLSSTQKLPPTSLIAVPAAQLVLARRIAASLATQ